MKQLNEFSIFSNLKQYDTVLGEAVYSSEEVKDKLKNIIEKSSLKSVYNQLSYLIDENIILPCYTSPNFIRSLMNKVFSNKIDKKSYGLYSKNHKKIYIFMSNFSKMFFFVNKNKLIKTLTHELMHYCCAKETSRFISIFKKDLLKFYKTFFINFFEEGENIVENRNLSNILNFLMMNFELRSNINHTALYNYAYVLEKNIQIDDMILKRESIVHLLSPVKIYLQSPKTYMNAITSNQNIRHIITSIYKSYHKINVNSLPDTIPIQEIIFPSEIIAIQSMYDFNNKHIQLLKGI